MVSRLLSLVNLFLQGASAFSSTSFACSLAKQWGNQDGLPPWRSLLQGQSKGQSQGQSQGQNLVSRFNEGLRVGRGWEESKAHSLRSLQMGGEGRDWRVPLESKAVKVLFCFGVKGVWGLDFGFWVLGLWC